MPGKLNALVAMSVYGREHGLTYPQVSALLESGKLTYEDMGAENPLSALDIEAERTTTFDFEAFPVKRCEHCGKQIKDPSNPAEKYCTYACKKAAAHKEKVLSAKPTKKAEPLTLNKKEQRNKRILALKEAGIPCSEIAKIVGLSNSRVFEIIRDKQDSDTTDKPQYTPATDCVFRGLFNWMEAHKCGYKELLELSNVWADVPSVHRRLSGNTKLRKEDIDELIRITNSTYEQLFMEAV